MVYTNASDETGLFFGEPITGKVHQLYSGITDDGIAISTHWYSKSYDDKEPDVMKHYFDSTFIFGEFWEFLNSL